MERQKQKAHVEAQGVKEGDLLLGITASARLPRAPLGHSVTGLPGKTEGELPEPLSGQGLFLMASLSLSVPTLLAKGVGVGNNSKAGQTLQNKLLEPFCR